MRSSSRRSPTTGRQIKPRPYFDMKLIASGVAFSAAITKSPSFSGLSSSTTMIILPSRRSARASSIVLKTITAPIPCRRPVDPAPLTKIRYQANPYSLSNSQLMLSVVAEARNFLTYFPKRSASRLTSSPTVIWPSVVFSRVTGIRATLNRSPFNAAMVRLTPSTATDPLGMRYSTSSPGAENSITSEPWPVPLLLKTIPTPSIWPVTKCPPRRWPTDKARSRLTWSPGASRPRAVRFRVSWLISISTFCPTCRAIVRQAPFTETDSPISKGNQASGRDRRKSASRPARRTSKTSPRAPTIPVNIPTPFSLVPTCKLWDHTRLPRLIPPNPAPDPADLLRPPQLGHQPVPGGLPQVHPPRYAPEEDRPRPPSRVR